MRIVRSISEVREAVGAARREGAVVGFVPTMGYLHEGHLSLADVAREQGAGFIVVSIFVNPLQFGPNEDLSRYPRDEQRDVRLLEEAGVDLLFLPPVEVMYPEGATTIVNVRGVSEPLEGERRPGHFDGVATVVAKLFNIVQADVAAFGRKDAQQCAVIEQMVRDLDLPVRLLFGETVRERDGLAMSSRNSYLSPDERRRATVLYRALSAGREAIDHDAATTASVERTMLEVLVAEPDVELDYLRLVDPQTFLAPVDFDRDLLLVGAVKLGRTRLIDNLRVGRRASFPSS